MLSRLLSVREAANYLGISTWTLRAMVRAGAMPRVSLPGVRRLLFDREELGRVIERHLSSRELGAPNSASVLSSRDLGEQQEALDK